MSYWFASFLRQIKFRKAYKFFINHLQGSVDQRLFMIVDHTKSVFFTLVFCLFISSLEKGKTKNCLLPITLLCFSRFHKSIFHYCLTPNDKSPLLSCLMSSLKEREMSKKERKKWLCDIENWHVFSPSFTGVSSKKISQRRVVKKGYLELKLVDIMKLR